MSNLSKEFVNFKGRCFQVSVSYTKGGPNYFTGGTTPRSYELSVTPVKVTDVEGGATMVSFVAFTGIRMTLLEVERASKKAAASALQLAADNLLAMLRAVYGKNPEAGSPARPEDRVVADTETVRYRVFRRSTNTNAFGLYGLWVMARDGKCFEVAASYLNAKQIGEYYDVPTVGGIPSFAHVGVECPTEKPTAPKEVADILWTKEPGQW